MFETVVAIIMLIVGALIGFLAAVGKDALLENKKNIQKEKEFKKQKLEEAFELANFTFVNNIKPLEIRESDGGHNGAKLSMIIRFYFPSLDAELKLFVDGVVAINKIFDIKNDTSIESEFTVFANIYRKFSAKIVEESKSF